MRWQYLSESISGNFHEAAIWISKHHPEWDVIAMQYIGIYTVVVYRVEIRGSLIP